MKARPPLAGPAAFWLGVALAIALGVGLGACGGKEPHDERVLRCFEQGFRWYGGECRDADGLPVEPGR